MLLFIVVSIGVVLKVAVDHLLYGEATAAAESWARYVVDNVDDIGEIASGAQPSAESMKFFIRTQQIRNLFRFEIADLQGNVHLVSDGMKITSPRGKLFDPSALMAAKLGRPVIEVKTGTPPLRPLHYSEAFLPFTNGGTRAVVAAYVDLTKSYDEFRNVFLMSVVTLCLLTGAGVSIPMIAWQRLTKEKQRADRRIRFLAAHDPLTNVLNRSSLVERLGFAFAALRPKGKGVAVHFIDIDHFKGINDSFGHDGGDVVLKTVAARFAAITRLEDTVARFGGDELVVLQANVSDKEQAEAFALRLHESAAEPINFQDQEIMITVSIGVALAPADGLTPERLLKSADLALYESKAAGRDCVRLFLPNMDAELTERITLEKAVRNAVATGNFVLHFQPVFELGKKLIGFEALVRLPAEDGSLIPPMAFIPVAEELRLIDKVGTWVLREACRVAATWPNNLIVAVNVSPAQFACGNISDIIADALKESGLDARRLEIEITESLLITDAESAIAELHKIKKMGVSIVMDDFGTGYSSLSYLWRFPFNKIKIDRSFMLGLDRSGRDAETVVKSIVALGRELKMRVTVEGVETARQVAFLEGIPGDQVQGYFFGHPIPASEISPELLATLQPPEPTRKPRTRCGFQGTAGQLIANPSIRPKK